ncbi:MAG: flavodoxin [Oscillibacter sp.]|nr:flavodoxin [Oscillibacter sp.]
MKTSLSFLLVLALCCVLTACGGGQDVGSNAFQPPAESQQAEPSASPQPQEAPDDSTPANTPESSEPNEESTVGNGILIAYFTYGENAPLADGVDATTSASIQYRGDALTGNIGLVADMIANATGGELFSILTTEQYPDNYDDTLDAAQAEKGSRPELASHIDSLDSYDTVFLGYPNWWGDMPMAVYSFLDEYDLSGKTIVPFVSSGGSGFSSTIRAIENAEPDATVLEGLSISASRVPQAEDDVADWLSRLGLAG